MSMMESMEDGGTFVCGGKVNINDNTLSYGGPLRGDELEKLVDPFSDISLDDRVAVTLFNRAQPASTIMFHLKTLIKRLQMQLMVLERCETTKMFDTVTRSPDLYDIRRSVCNFLTYIRVYLDSLRTESSIMQPTLMSKLQNDLNDLVNIVKRFLAQLKQIPPSIFHYAVSNSGNRCSQPEFHLYHMHLELRWLLLSIVYAQAKKTHSDGSEELVRTVGLIVNDLVYISLKIFDRTNLSDLKLKSPYSCTCVRELWLALQFFISDVKDALRSRSFWDFVNATLDVILGSAQGADNEFSWHGERSTPSTKSQREELFAIWLIYHLTLLQGYSRDGKNLGSLSPRIQDNYTQLGVVLKSFATDSTKQGLKDGVDEELKVMMPLLEKITVGWWTTKMLVINHLWECFHRRLDRPFLIQVSGPWSIALEKKSPMDILDQVKARLDKRVDGESSYSIFLRFLGITLRKGIEENNPKYWQQVRGKIYTKFTKGKVQDFDESALYNFISLFLTLAISTSDTANICNQMFELLPAVQDSSGENLRRISLIWKGQLATLLIYTESNLHLGIVAAKVTDVVNVLSCRKDDLGRSMMGTFVEVLRKILSRNEPLQHGEYHFISGWIDRYLMQCSTHQAEIMLKLLLRLFDKTKESLMNSPASEVTKIIDLLWGTVAGRLRLMAFEPATTGDKYLDVAKLAVEFTMEAIRDPAMAQSHSHSDRSFFMLFTSTVRVKDVRLTKLYLALILDKPKIVEALKRKLENFDVLVIQAWIKCCFHGQDGKNPEIKRIKNYILEIEDFKLLFRSWLATNQFKESEESFILYLTALGQRRNEIQGSQRITLDRRTRVFFNDIDKWVLKPITKETCNTPQASWIYRCLGTFFLVCSSILHQKNQPSVLKTYLKQLLLPADDKMDFLKQLGKRIFSMVIMGLENANAKSDVTLHDVVLQLFRMYLPLLVIRDETTKSATVADSLSRCFTDTPPNFVNFLLEILSANYLKTSNDNSLPKHWPLFMALLSKLLYLQTITSGNLIEIIILKCINLIIESFIKIFYGHPFKTEAVDFLTELMATSSYREDTNIRNLFNSTLQSVVLNYVANIPQTTFEFLRMLTSKNAAIVELMIPQIEAIAASSNYRGKNGVSSPLEYQINQLKAVLQTNKR